MAISYRPSGITITDDTGARPAIELPPTATQQEVDAAAASYSDPPPDWLAFAAWLYQFPPINNAMAAARLSTAPQGEPATTGLPAALQEARLERNYPAWAATWGQFLAASNMASADLAQIVVTAAACKLPPEFIAALQPQDM